MSDGNDEDRDTTTYRDAGVDRDRADDAVDRYRAPLESTRIPGVVEGIGGFGGVFDLADAGLLDKMDHPVLVAGADGVGTKLQVAFQTRIHDTIGIDCVAMCVNDVITTGARPLFFLDYLSTGELDPGQAEAVVEGIAAGCRRAECALLGGETAEMPGFYPAGEYDIAGFCVGAVDRDDRITPDRVDAGDHLVGLASSGIHSNGFSLVRKIVDEQGWDWSEPRPELDASRPLGELLLEPTRIYVEPVARLRRDFDVHGLVHVTGGGLPANVPRALPDGLQARVSRDSWETPAIFDFVGDAGNVPTEERYRVFNMGIGFVAVLPADQSDDACAELGELGWEATVIGTVK